MTTEITPATIAATVAAEGLTALVRASMTGDPWRGDVWTNFILIRDGLLAYRRRWWLFGPKRLYLTRKGKAVRAILQEQSNEG